MPQNWWELFPEIQPSPAARPRALPGPGDAMPGSAMSPRPAAPYDAYGPDQAPPGAFDPAYFSGGDLGADEFPDRHPAQVTSTGLGEPALAGVKPAMDRNAAIQHAAAAIQRGADPEAVRARLNEIGHAHLDPASPFIDLIPDGQQAREVMNGPGMGLSREPQPTLPDQGEPNPSLYSAAIAKDRVASLQRRADVTMAPQKADDLQKSYQSKGGLPQAGQSGHHHALVFTSSHSGKPSPPHPNVNGYGYVPAPNDVNLLARTLYAEFSTVNNWRDMQAGAWTIVNRIRPSGRWPRYRTADTIGTSLFDVLNKRARDGTPQYSFVPPGGIGAAGGSERWQESAHPQTLTGSARQAWMWAVDTARRVLGGGASDPTGGATHFYNRSVGTPNTVGGFFRDATKGSRPTLTYSPYRSPNGQNFFLRTIEDPPRRIPWTPVHHLTVPPRRND